MLTDGQFRSLNINDNIFLPQMLLSTIQSTGIDKTVFSGYLKFEMLNSYENNTSNPWYLFFSRGKIVFSGNDLIHFNSILSALKNYIPDLRNENLVLSKQLQRIAEKKSVTPDISMILLLGNLALQLKTLGYQKITESIELYILENIEKQFFKHTQKVEVFTETKIDLLRPIVGLEVENILAKVMIRKNQWEKIISFIPSIKHCVQCNTNSPQWQRLTAIDQQKIRKLASAGNTLEEISYKLGEDSLKIAQVFSRLVEQKLVVVNPEQNNLPETFGSSIIEPTSVSIKPQLAVIDDSVILLRKFSSVVRALGYEIQCCDDALKAVDILLQYEPKAIFIDINMPQVSGFQLIKKIRSQTKLSSVPLIILTAEKTMMNQQRAKWSKSKFLSKPLTPDDNLRFVTELKTILHDLVPIKK